MSSWTPTKYKTTNWSTYNDALKCRRSLAIWFDPEMIWTPPPSGKRGRQKTLNGSLPYRGGTGPLNLLMDSTGIKAEGEGGVKRVQAWRVQFRPGKGEVRSRPDFVQRSQPTSNVYCAGFGRNYCKFRFWIDFNLICSLL